jgi:hypothetical protein
MKTALITVSVAAAALWVGYTIGYHHGADATFATFRPRHFVSEVTTYSGHALNRGPQTIIFTNGVVSK